MVLIVFCKNAIYPKFYTLKKTCSQKLTVSLSLVKARSSFLALFEAMVRFHLSESFNVLRQYRAAHTRRWTLGKILPRKGTNPRLMYIGDVDVATKHPESDVKSRVRSLVESYGD